MIIEFREIYIRTIIVRHERELNLNFEVMKIINRWKPKWSTINQNCPRSSGTLVGRSFLEKLAEALLLRN